MPTKYLASISLLALSLSYFSVRATIICHSSLFLIYFINAKKISTIKINKFWLATLIIINTLALLISIRHEVHINFYIKFLLFTTYSLLFLVAIRNKLITSSQVVFSCNFFIIIHSFCFLIQLATYLTTGKYIDFDSYIRESTSEALYATKALEDLFISIRATGLFSEPSFYAMTVLPATLLLALHQKKITPITVAGFLTTVASLSIAAILISLLALALTFITIKSKKIYIIAVAFAIAIASPLLFTVYEKRIIESVDYDAVYSRQLIFNEFKVRGITNNLFGNGFFWNESFPVGKTMMQGYHTRDSSFYVYMFFTSGALGLALLFIAVTLPLRRNIKYAIALAILFLFKFHVLSGALWLTITLVAIFTYIESKALSAQKPLTPTIKNAR